MNILIVNRYGDPDVEEFSYELEKLLHHHGHHTSIYKENLLGEAPPLFSGEHPPDLAIVIGGDGTILLTTQRMPVQVPLIGINYGEVGFLADIEPEEVHTFVSHLTRPLQLEARMRIELRMNGQHIGTAQN
jgi:NAD+ kinase